MAFSLTTPPRRMTPGERLGRMLDELARISDEPGALTRLFLSPGMRRANAQVGAWMQEAGLTARQDAVGNLIGRREPTARAPGRTRPKTLLLGSHLDTVRNAGRFDGALGVLAPLVALQELDRRGIMLPYAVEVIGFSEEEGVRFSSAYLGSKGFVGALTAADLKRSDNMGVTVREAISRYTLAPFVKPRPAHRPSELLGYLEVHIEQGPVLERERLGVGVVSAIAGQTRGRIDVKGRAGHAGTTPMTLRRDALAGAAEVVLAIEAAARRERDLVATVGMLSVPAGAPNVIPGEAWFTLDLRHPDDARRTAALARLLRTARQIARRRHLQLSWHPTQDHGATACSPGLSRRLEASVRAVQGRSRRLASGAGHDGVVVAQLAPIAMLFVRCRGGLSHHPDEYVTPADLDTAVDVLVHCLQHLDPNVHE